MLYGQLRKNLGDVFRNLARQKESRVLEGTFAIRPCAHSDFDTAEMCGIAGGWLHKREKRDPYSAD